ncbi:MAG TPA: hypothetical protein VLZ29_02630 [Sulfurimonas sp.]|uniref:hypothetical protein n=1 Tax=Sulfurimonas sp. TaxID=2022749 RepID=UPI002C900272|nr:hypothetical protein [Sulfurimonas sp.]HUH41990.1 hypothetical protein [Sulfurimonas sp.]
MKQQYEDFDEFIAWLKKDGLKPLKSERIWKKKIFTNLVNNHKKSIENYNDFLQDKKMRGIIGKKTTYKDFNKLVYSVDKSHNFYKLILEDRSILKVRIEDIDEFIKNYIRGELK